MTFLVRVMGLEPIRLSTHAPQTCLSAYSSTLAKYLNIIHLINRKVNRHQKIIYILQWRNKVSTILEQKSK